MSNITPVLRERCHSLALVAVSTLLLALAAGCGMVQTAVDAPGNALRAVTPGLTGRPPVNPVDVQQSLLRFAVEINTRISIGIDKLEHGTNALDRAESLRWKIALSTETCSIASGPNAIANLLDMTIFVTITRMALEEHWQPKVFGASGQPLLDSCRAAETEIWVLAAKVLTPQEQTELRDATATWHQDNPHPESILAARGVGYAPQVAQAKTTGAKPSSVFDLLRVDPLSSLDPAVRELAQTRLFAERVLFVFQQMPILLRWQTELLTVNAVELPAVQQLLVNTTQLTDSVDRFARVAEQLPQQLSTEREEILKALESQEEQLTPLVNEVRQTLLAGSQMSTSLTTTITTFDALMQRFGVGEGEQTNRAPADTNATPFRIQDYTDAAMQMDAAARQLTELLVTFDRTLGSTNLTQLAAQVSPVVQQAQTTGKELVDYAFWKGILLVVVALAAALVYRVLARMLPRATSEGHNPR